MIRFPRLLRLIWGREQPQQGERRGKAVHADGELDLKSIQAIMEKISTRTSITWKKK